MFLFRGMFYHRFWTIAISLWLYFLLRKKFFNPLNSLNKASFITLYWVEIRLSWFECWWYLFEGGVAEVQMMSRGYVSAPTNNIGRKILFSYDLYLFVLGVIKNYLVCTVFISNYCFLLLLSINDFSNWQFVFIYWSRHRFFLVCLWIFWCKSDEGRIICVSSFDRFCFFFAL